MSVRNITSKEVKNLCKGLVSRIELGCGFCASIESHPKLRNKLLIISFPNPNGGRDYRMAVDYVGQEYKEIANGINSGISDVAPLIEYGVKFNN